MGDPWYMSNGKPHDTAVYLELSWCIKFFKHTWLRTRQLCYDQQDAGPPLKQVYRQTLAMCTAPQLLKGLLPFNEIICIMHRNIGTFKIRSIDQGILKPGGQQ